MRIIRHLGNVALWVGALLGIVAGGVWAAGQLGWVQPLIVISGSGAGVRVTAAAVLADLRGCCERLLAQRCDHPAQVWQARRRRFG